jgi:four helix bundle protein
MFIFETFPVYQKSAELYQEVRVYLQNNKIDKYVSDQLRRALLSVVLNIAEGSGKFSKKEKRNFYLMARASVYECVAVVNLLLAEELTNELLIRWKEELLIVHKMLSGMIKSFSENI